MTGGGGTGAHGGADGIPGAFPAEPPEPDADSEPAYAPADGPEPGEDCWNADGGQAGRAGAGTSYSEEPPESLFRVPTDPDPPAPAPVGPDPVERESVERESVEPNPTGRESGEVEPDDGADRSSTGSGGGLEADGAELGRLYPPISGGGTSDGGAG